MGVETSQVGTVAELWRYPVKSMRGEQVTATALNDHGLTGDRGYGVLERATGHIASAKHPRKWSALIACRASFVTEPRPGAPLPPVAITLPDGSIIESTERDVDQVLSRVLGREVTLVTSVPRPPTREADRTPIDGGPDDVIIREELMANAAPPGTFFDYAPIHILTTATLAHLRELYEAGQWDVRRFRPNIVVAPATDAGFVEQAWLGRELALGDAIRLRLIDPTARCVITTLAQGDLPRDTNILRTLARHSSSTSVTLAPGVVLSAIVGVYGGVVAGGSIECGTPVVLH